MLASDPLQLNPESTGHRNSAARTKPSDLARSFFTSPPTHGMHCIAQHRTVILSVLIQAHVNTPTATCYWEQMSRQSCTGNLGAKTDARTCKACAKPCAKPCVCTRKPSVARHILSALPTQ